MAQKKLNPHTVGLFVVGALVLAVAGLFAFGSRSYFEKRPRAVSYFHGSVAGLSVGAPVTFRGVRIGQVASIAVQINDSADVARIPVIVEFEPDKVAATTNGAGSNFIQRMIAHKLGASLVMQSFITGQLAIELDYHADAEPPAESDPYLPEIPEVAGGLNAMKDTISKLPIQDLADKALSVLRNLDEIVSAPETRDMLKYGADTLRAVSQAAKALEDNTPGVARNLSETSAAAARLSERLDKLLVELQPHLLKLVGDLDRLLAATDTRTGQLTGDLRSALGDVRGLLAPRSAVMQDIQTLLRNLAVASTSMRSFADQVERNPNTLLMGKSH